MALSCIGTGWHARQDTVRVPLARPLVVLNAMRTCCVRVRHQARVQARYNEGTGICSWDTARQVIDGALLTEPLVVLERPADPVLGKAQAHGFQAVYGVITTLLSLPELGRCA